MKLRETDAQLKLKEGEWVIGEKVSQVTRKELWEGNDGMNWVKPVPYFSFVLLFKP